MIPTTLSLERLASRPHGTRVRYVAGRCRCLLCRAANSRFESARLRARAAGDWNGIVDARRARCHLVRLSALGIGRRTVSEIAGVSQTVLHKIKTGRRPRIRARTEREILRVTPAAMNDARLVPAGPTWFRIRRLLAEGFTKAEIARRLGYRVPALQFRTDRVTARTALRVERFYRRMMR